MHDPTTIGVVGTTKLAATIVHTLGYVQAADEIILADAAGDYAEGAAADHLRTHSPAGRVTVHTGTCARCSGAQLVILAIAPEEARGSAEGKADPPSVPSTAQMKALRGVIPELDATAPDAVLLIAAPPYDALTTAAQHLSRRPPAQVLGLGTFPATIRLRRRLAAHFQVSDDAVYATVVGPAGPDAVVAWDRVLIGGEPVADGALLNAWLDVEAAEALHRAPELEDEDEGRPCANSPEVRAIVQVTRAMLGDTRAVLPVSTHWTGAYGIGGVAMSLPCVLGRSGRLNAVTPTLTHAHVCTLRTAAERIRTALRTVDGGVVAV